MALFKRATPRTHVHKVEHGYFRLGTVCTHAPLDVFCVLGGGHISIKNRQANVPVGEVAANVPVGEVAADVPVGS